METRNYKENYPIDNSIQYTNSKNFIIYGVLSVLTGALVIGVLVGFVVGLFMVLVEVMASFSAKGYAFMLSNPKFIPLGIVIVIILAFIMWLLIRKTPEARGGGVPRAVEMSRGENKGRPFKIMYSYFLGASVSFLAGLNVGTEGPSVQLGAATGALASDVCHLKNKTYYIYSGIGAGFASAFGTPFTGLIFALEEVRKKFNPLAIGALCLAIFGSMTSSQIIYDLFNVHIDFFPIEQNALIDPQYFYIFIILGCICGIVSVLFQKSFIFIRKNINRSKLNMWPVLFGVFLTILFVSLAFTRKDGSTYFNGSGLGLVKYIFSNPNGTIDTYTAIFVVIIRFILCMLCFRSQATGGTMIPTLTIGALIGVLTGDMYLNAGLPDECFHLLVICGMVAFFGSSISAPLTAFFLVFETTGVRYLPYVILSLGIAFIITKLCGCGRHYEEIAKPEALNPPEYIFLKC